MSKLCHYIEFERGFTLTLALAESYSLASRQCGTGWILELPGQFCFPSFNLQRHHVFSLHLTFSGLTLERKILNVPNR